MVVVNRHLGHRLTARFLVAALCLCGALLSCRSGDSTVNAMYPPDGQVRERSRVTLWWDPAPQGSRAVADVRFEVEVDGEVSTVASVYSTHVLNGGRHAWRVRPVNEDDRPGTWTALRTITVTPPEYEENERTAFFDDFVEKTVTRTAWSPEKWRKLGTTYEAELELHNLKAEFARADDETRLLRALLKLHSIQKDHHLTLEVTAEPLDRSTTYAPIRFYPDMSDFSDLYFFVANYAPSVAERGVERGDKLIAVNGVPAPEYIRWLDVSVQYSTRPQGYFRAYGSAGENPGFLSAKSPLLDPILFNEDNTVTYTLEDRQSGEWTDVTLEYSIPRGEPVDWALEPIMGGGGVDNREYYETFYESLGFTRISSDFPANEDAALWVKPDEELAVLEWFDFENAQNSVADIVAAAERHGALEYDLIIDATHSSGGGGAPYTVQILTDEPFRPTFGNVRVTDRAFTESHLNDHGPEVAAWIRAALDAGRDYTTDEPFKLQYPATMQPAETRFTGSKVLLMFPWGGSQLDQFVSIVVDNAETNGIHTIGTTMGGYSNTWEWGQGDIPVPGLDEGIFVEWNIGHTIRPNGEILEGNGAMAAEWIPFTRDNAGRYFRELIARAAQYLKG
jgi:hypothetical protein